MLFNVLGGGVKTQDMSVSEYFWIANQESITVRIRFRYSLAVIMAGEDFMRESSLAAQKSVTTAKCFIKMRLLIEDGDLGLQASKG